MRLIRYVEILAKDNEELKNYINNLKASSLGGNFESPKISSEQMLEIEYFEKKEKEPCLVSINKHFGETYGKCDYYYR